MEDKNLGMLASPLFTHKREASAAQSRIYHPNSEISVSCSSHIPCSAGKRVAMYSHKRKPSRDPKSSQESCSEREREELRRTSGSSRFA